MQIHKEHINFWGFSNLIADYLDGKIPSEWYAHAPNEQGLLQAAREKNFSISDRENLVAIIKNQYKGDEVKIPNALSLLENQNCYCITTGHQLSLFGGARYFIYKIVSIIKLSRALNESQREFRLVPVFWLASEDHDFDEANHFEYNKHKFGTNESYEGAVGNLASNIWKETLIELKKLVQDKENFAEIIQIFEDSFDKRSWSASTRYWVSQLFGDELIIIDGNDKDLKQKLRSVIKKECLEYIGFNTLNKTNLQLRKNGYKIQVNPREINLFYLQKNYRKRIISNEHGFATSDRKYSWKDSSSLLEEIENKCENFSPNAILRPLYQEMVLPNVAYIGGPGELAYWLQIKSMFDAYGVNYPCVLLRDSFCLMDEKDNAQYQQLGLNTEQFLHPNFETFYLNHHYGEITSIKKLEETMLAYHKQIIDTTQDFEKHWEAMILAQQKRNENFLGKLHKKIRAKQRKEAQNEIKLLNNTRVKYINGSILNERKQGILDDLEFFNSTQDLLNVLIENSDCINPHIKVLQIKKASY